MTATSIKKVAHVGYLKILQVCTVYGVLTFMVSIVNKKLGVNYEAISPLVMMML